MFRKFKLWDILSYTSSYKKNTNESLCSNYLTVFYIENEEIVY